MKALFGEAVLELVEASTYRYTRPERRYRFLMSTGETVDVVTSLNDDSTLREDLLERFPKDTMIAGSLRMGEP